LLLIGETSAACCLCRLCQSEMVQLTADFMKAVLEIKVPLISHKQDTLS